MTLTGVLLILAPIGLATTIVGVVVLTLASPENTSVIDGGTGDTDFERIHAETAQRNRRIRVGLWTVVAGTILQLPAAIIACL